MVFSISKRIRKLPKDSFFFCLNGHGLKIDDLQGHGLVMVLSCYRD